MPRCVYCLEDKPRDEFTREHVIQEGFGRFKGALTLPTAVCGACNQLFGDTIDRELQREGAEGLERYRWGARSPEELGKFRYSQVTLRAKDAGDFANARFELRPGPGPDSMVGHLVPTVAFAKRDGTGFVEYSEAQLRSQEWRANPDIDWEKGVKAFGDKEALDRLVDLLAAQGVRPKNMRYFQLPTNQEGEITVEQSFVITDIMYRALAKIGFNYLVWREGPAFALAPAFDPIRRFVRYGEIPPLPPVLTTNQLPFGVPNPEGERPVVHFVCISTRHPSHSNVLAVVSLFGFTTHTIMLAEGYAGPWPRPLAHLYNLKDRTVHPWEPGIPFTPRGDGQAESPEGTSGGAA